MPRQLAELCNRKRRKDPKAHTGIETGLAKSDDLTCNPRRKDPKAHTGIETMMSKTNTYFI